MILESHWFVLISHKSYRCFLAVASPQSVAKEAVQRSLSDRASPPPPSPRLSPGLSPSPPPPLCNRSGSPPPAPSPTPPATATSPAATSSWDRSPSPPRQRSPSPPRQQKQRQRSPPQLQQPPSEQQQGWVALREPASMVQQQQPIQAVPIPDPTVDLDPTASLNEIKCALLDVVYGTARGVNASLDQRAQV